MPVMLCDSVSLIVPGVSEGADMVEDFELRLMVKNSHFIISGQGLQLNLISLHTPTPISEQRRSLLHINCARV